MENQNLILKLSRLFPSSFSSCKLGTVTADVADDNSIAITKSKKIPHDNDQTAHNFLRSKPTKGPKCPHSPPVPNLNLKKNHSAVNRGSRHHYICKTGGVSSVVSSVINNNSNNQVSCSSNSGFFSSSEDEGKVKKDAETDTFFSLSSNSGDSFRLKTSRRFRTGEETVMKTIKEKERSSFSSAKISFDLTALSSESGDMKKNYCNKTTTKKCSNKSQENNLFFSASDHHAYYFSNKKASDVNARNRVRRTRVKKRSLKSGSMLIEESRAVEKRSTDPRGDFRASMVEMIVEKQMVSATELESLLLCFLSLNNVSYHEMISEVFSEICETLFDN